MKLGIIGLPQSGKTTIFNALTRGNAPTTASAGRFEVHTAVVDVPDPRVTILSSGDEVVPPESRPAIGQVRDVNSFTLAALVTRRGGQANIRGIVPDRADALEDALREAWKSNDLVVITAGSSASTRDLTAQTIQKIGRPGVLVHGVNVKPGKPTILGICDGKAVIGLPGNPVSALVIAGLFVLPVIDRLLGLKTGRLDATVAARLTVNLASQAGREDYIPVRLLATGEGYSAVTVEPMVKVVPAVPPEWPAGDT